MTLNEKYQLKEKSNKDKILIRYWGCSEWISCTFIKGLLKAFKTLEFGSIFYKDIAEWKNKF